MRSDFYQSLYGPIQYMKTSYECIPCFIRQALDAARFATSDEAVHETVLREVLTSVSKMDLKQSPPVMGQHIHRLVRKFSGSIDPYKKVKEKFNGYALQLYPNLKEKIETSSNPFETAVRLAIAGNIIDFGVHATVNHAIINKTIELSLSEPLFGDLEYFQKTISAAKTILYIGDNSGEIVFDRLLIEQLRPDRLTFSVRGNPILNDATIDDAVDTGMTDIVHVIDNGSDAPGTVLDECSDMFRRLFQSADIVISKGQGNYETLSDIHKNIFFLLKAKCTVTAKHIGCNLGDSVIGRNII